MCAVPVTYLLINHDMSFFSFILVLADDYRYYIYHYGNIDLLILTIKLCKS